MLKRLENKKNSHFFLIFVGLFFLVYYQNSHASLILAPVKKDVEINAQVLTMQTNKGLSPVSDISIKVTNITKLTSAGPRSPINVPSSIQNALNHLQSIQNSDGSWGNQESTKFVTTVAVLEALQAYNISSPSITKGIEWLSYYFTDNGDFLAQKLPILITSGEATSTIDSLLHYINETDNGFVVDRGFKSDVITTAKALKSLSAANQKDYGTDPDITKKLAVKYLAEKILGNNTWSAFEGGQSSYIATAETIEAISPWRYSVISNINIGDVLNRAVSTLRSSQLTNGTWSNNLLKTAVNFRAIKKANDQPIYESQAVEYLTNSLSTFDNIHTSAKVLSALAYSIDQGDLIVEDITPTTILQTGTTTAFDVRVYNPSGLPVSTGALRVIADGYFISSIDLAQNNISIPAGGTVNINLTFGITRQFTGNVIFKIYVDRAGGLLYTESKFSKTFTFAPNPNLRPAVPLYFAAYKSVGSNSTPAITWRWPIKFDPYLKNIVLMFRKQGDTTWTQASVTATTTASSATVSNLINDQIYEATIGTSAESGQIYFITTPALVKTSSSINTYTAGVVNGSTLSLAGGIPSLNISGVTTSSNTSTSQSGTFSATNVPWGRVLFRVNNPAYETFVRTTNVADNAIPTLNIYTDKKADLSMDRFFAALPTGAGATTQIFSANKTVFFSLSIKNTISQTTPKTSVKIYVNNNLINTCEVSELASGASKSLMCGQWLTTTGIHSIKAVLDQENTVEESNEGNNQMIATITVN